MKKKLENLFPLPSKIEPLDLSAFGINNHEVYIKRDDLIHNIVSGNKWRKLKLHISDFLLSDKEGILTFGGTYSNHIIATAYVANYLNIPSLAVIRGEEPKNYSTTLKYCSSLGMKFIFSLRNEYKNKEVLLANILIQNNNLRSYYFIPEGGASKLGIMGCKEIVDEINIPFDEIYCDVGTGATLAGLTLAIGSSQDLIGINVLKGADYLDKEIQNMISSVDDNCINKFTLLNNYHFGGYAKNSKILIEFMREFYNKTGVKTDPIYSGKMFYALVSELRKKKKSKKIIAIHTGGLQGIEGFETRYKLKIYS